jgi:hypothetical protein
MRDAEMSDPWVARVGFLVSSRILNSGLLFRVPQSAIRISSWIPDSEF